MLEVLKDGFKVAFKSPITYVALIAVPIIVSCFGLLYVNTFMDPYERMKSLPVAIINEDSGAQSDGEWKNYGDELAESICENDSVKWVVEDTAILDEGLEKSDYYMAVIIPSDFSQRVIAGQTSTPEQANITFFKNVRKNYMLSTFSKSVETALQLTVNQKIGEQYTSAYVQGLYDAQEGLSDAADGAGELAEGIETAKDGSESLASGLEQIGEGANILNSAIGQLESGANSLESGASSAASGASTLASGTAQLQSGAEAISSKGASLAQGSASFKQGLVSLGDGATTYVDTLNEKLEAIADTYGGDPQDALPTAQQSFANELATYTTSIVVATKTGQDPTKVDATGVTQAAASMAQISAQAGAYQALQSASEGAANIDAGVAQLNESYSTLDEGIEGYTSAAAQLSNAASSVNSGVSSLSEGVSKLESGSSSLASGLSSAASGSSSLASSIETAQSGSSQLSDGFSTAIEGADTLSESLDEGAKTISDSLTDTPDNIASYISNPVEFQDDAYGDLPSFGYGFAPLFITMCMWLGSLIAFFIFDPFPSNGKLGKSRFAVIFGRLPLALLIAAINAIVVGACAHAIGVPCTDSAAYVAFFATTAITFICIMELLNLFDIAGKAIALLLLIVQLVCCSGTFPAMLGNDAAAAIGPCLPFYYAIDAFREIMSGTNIGAAYVDMGALLLFAAVALVLSIAAYPLALKMKHKHDASTIARLTEAAL